MLNDIFYFLILTEQFVHEFNDKSLKFKCPHLHDHTEFKNPFWQIFITNKLILQSWKKTNQNENAEFSFME